ncbi:MAG: D-Ala-D-Ala carboxypeptidase family metallohydrolase [Hyphomicrobiaceae bacterium]
MSKGIEDLMLKAMRFAAVLSAAGVTAAAAAPAVPGGLIMAGAAAHARIGAQSPGSCGSPSCQFARGRQRGLVAVAYRGDDDSSDETADKDDADERPARASRSKRTPRHKERGGRDSADAPRSCLTSPARALLDRIEGRFGQVRVISTCRPGATIAGTGRPSRHASGNAIDFDAGGRKAAIVSWLIANHKAGGTMTYSDMSHIHVDIGRHFVSLAARSHRGGTSRRSAARTHRRGSDRATLAHAD